MKQAVVIRGLIGATLLAGAAYAGQPRWTTESPDWKGLVLERVRISIASPIYWRFMRQWWTLMDERSELWRIVKSVPVPCTARS